MFRFALVSTEGEALGEVAFARGDWRPGDVIPQGPGRNLRVTAVVEPEQEGDLPLLVVESAE
jgi:hypothetical protein